MSKLSCVDEENREEARALARWGGAAAVTLPESAPEDGALLLERLDAHRSLQQVDEDDAVALAAALLLKLHVPPLVGQVSVTGIARRWQAACLRSGRYSAARDAGNWSSTRSPRAPSRPRGQVQRSLHGDYHYGNVLARPLIYATGVAAAEPQKWAAIDPKPLATTGSTTWFLCCGIAGTSSPQLVMRHGSVADPCTRWPTQAELDRERAQPWCLVRAVDDALWGHEHQAPGFAAIAWEIAEALH